MPNPPPPPPPQPSGPPPSLRKFSLIPSPPPNAPILGAINSAGPIPAADLQTLRGSLVLSRMLAADRLSTRDQNRAQLMERQAMEKRTAEEQARAKEGERRRKREDDERRERERVEKAERERVEREREERKRAKQAEKERDEQERKAQAQAQAGVAQQAKEKQRALDVLSLVHANEASRRNGADADGDVPMGDATPSGYASTPTSAFPTPPPPASKNPSKGSRAVASSAEPDDDATQPKPPRHHDKKKRKRDLVIDSDASDSETADQPLLQKLRKVDSQGSSDFRPSPSLPLAGPSAPLAAPLPPPPEPNALIERRLKEERFQKHSIPIKPPPPGGASAFFVPTTSLVPPKPPVVPPVPTAKRQSDVSGDFSNAKPGQQIAHSTFQNWVDAYLRPFGEDDLAFLAPKPEDIAPYLIPPLGRHYLDKWEEEDAELPGGPTHLSHAHHSHANHSLEPPPLPRLRPDALTEDALAMENVFLGPLSERLMAALAVDGGSGLAEDEDEDGGGRQEGEDGAVPPKLQMDAVELEERIKRELRFIGLLPEEEVDWSAREDDEISSALRACQRLLHHQTELNESRKSVLMSLVKDRMAYQDYETARDAQERVVETGWTKRTKVDTKKAKKKKDRDRNRAAGTKEAAGGGAADDPTKQPIPHELLEAVEKRGRLVQAFEPFFGEEEKGRFFGLPERSVYEGLEVGDEDDEEDELQLLGAPVAGPSSH
ncbi:hypothetical protein JCM6882_008809 [Rhodosporidiobolus microsporus]